jgi:hypothetical protein
MQIRTGQRVRVFGGYYGAHPCFGSEAGIEGVVTGFESGDGKIRVVILCDRWMTCSSTGNKGETVQFKWLICSLRYSHSEWDDGETVHVEISDVDPLARVMQHTTKRRWIESHATISIVVEPSSDT